MSNKRIYVLTDEQAKLGREIANMVLNLVGASGESGGVARCRDVADALATPIDTDAAVERMARGLSEHWRDMHTNESLGRQRMLARAALAALLGGGDDA